MKYGIDEVSEREFNDWMESVVFVDKYWNPLPVILTDDESDDPENDREGVDANLQQHLLFLILLFFITRINQTPSQPSLQKRNQSGFSYKQYVFLISLLSCLFKEMLY